jgi:hypothetical protein
MAGRKAGGGTVTLSQEALEESTMDQSLLQLMEELLESMEQRDAGDPDAPAWEATIRIRRLEEELARRLGSAADEAPLAVRPGTRAAVREEVLASLA